MRSLAGLLALAASAAAQATTCHVSNVLGSHMVLQRDRPANVWGWAAPGVTVTVSLNGNKQPAATAGADGKWLTALPAQPATATPSVLSFVCSDGTTPADIVDVLFGDVHICSGQCVPSERARVRPTNWLTPSVPMCLRLRPAAWPPSASPHHRSNMQFTLTSNAGVPNATAEIALANSYPNIRVFTVGDGTSSAAPLKELNTTSQQWSVAANTSIGGPGWDYMSAVCWFTYRDVYDALGGSVPQGLISNNWGGTPIQHWSSPDALKVCNGGTDSTLWNAMVNPYVAGPLAVRTAIWYQGGRSRRRGGILWRAPHHSIAHTFAPKQPTPPTPHQRPTWARRPTTTANLLRVSYPIPRRPDLPTLTVNSTPSEFRDPHVPYPHSDR